MRLGKKGRGGSSSAISSNLLTALLVGSFVGAVIIALVWTAIIPPVSQGTQLSFEGLELFGGSLSTHSFTSTCQGDAQVEVYVHNPNPNPITIQNVTIYGPSVKNATALIALSNSCLTISESVPTIPAGNDYLLVGYVDAPVQYTATYTLYILFSNGQILNETVLAQT